MEEGGEGGYEESGGKEGMKRVGGGGGGKRHIFVLPSFSKLSECFATFFSLEVVGI